MTSTSRTGCPAILPSLTHSALVSYSDEGAAGVAAVTHGPGVTTGRSPGGVSLDWPGC